MCIVRYAGEAGHVERRGKWVELSDFSEYTSEEEDGRADPWDWGQNDDMNLMIFIIYLFPVPDDGCRDPVWRVGVEAGREANKAQAESSAGWCNLRA